MKNKHTTVYIEEADYPPAMPNAVFVATILLAIVFWVIGAVTFSQCHGYFAATWFGAGILMVGIAAATVGGAAVFAGTGMVAFALIVFGIAASVSGGCTFAWPAPL